MCVCIIPKYLSTWLLLLLNIIIHNQVKRIFLLLFTCKTGFRYRRVSTIGGKRTMDDDGDDKGKTIVWSCSRVFEKQDLTKASLQFEKDQMAPVRLRVTFTQSRMWVAADCAVWLPRFVDDKGSKQNHFPGKSTSGSRKFLPCLMCVPHQKHRRWTRVWRTEHPVQHRGRRAAGHNGSPVKTRIFLIIQIPSGRPGMHALSSCHTQLRPQLKDCHARQYAIL